MNSFFLDVSVFVLILLLHLLLLLNYSFLLISPRDLYGVDSLVVKDHFVCVFYFVFVWTKTGIFLLFVLPLRSKAGRL